MIQQKLQLLLSMTGHGYIAGCYRTFHRNFSEINRIIAIIRWLRVQ